MSTQERCGVVFKGRPPCRQRAGWGTDHVGFGPCKLHGGSAPPSVHKQGLAVMQAAAMTAMLGSAPQVDPEETLLQLVSQSAGLVTFYGQEVQRLALLEPTQEVRGTFRNAVAGYETGAHLFGPVIDVDKDGGEHIVGEELRGMVKLWNDERDRLAKYAKTALGAGIERRRIEMAEQQGERIVVVINSVLVQLGFGPDVLQQARTLIATELRAVAVGERG